MRLFGEKDDHRTQEEAGVPSLDGQKIVQPQQDYDPHIPDLAYRMPMESNQEFHKHRKEGRKGPRTGQVYLALGGSCKTANGRAAGRQGPLPWEISIRGFEDTTSLS